MKLLLFENDSRVDSLKGGIPDNTFVLSNDSSVGYFLQSACCGSTHPSDEKVLTGPSGAGDHRGQNCPG